jgi:hypothetical protein
MRRVLFGAVVVLVLTVLAIGSVVDSPAEAARGGGGGGGGGSGGGQCKGGPKNCGGGTGTGVITVTPNPVPLGSQSVNISGTGFNGNEYLVVTLPGACCDVGATTDGGGNFTVTFPRDFDWPSTYIVEVYRAGVKVASTTFTVQ